MYQISREELLFPKSVFLRNFPKTRPDFSRKNHFVREAFMRWWCLKIWNSKILREPQIQKRICLFIAGAFANGVEDSTSIYGSGNSLRRVRSLLLFYSPLGIKAFSGRVLIRQGVSELHFTLRDFWQLHRTKTDSPHAWNKFNLFFLLKRSFHEGCVDAVLVRRFSFILKFYVKMSQLTCFCDDKEKANKYFEDQDKQKQFEFCSIMSFKCVINCDNFDGKQRILKKLTWSAKRF